MPKTLPAQFGRYAILRKLGEGGMGTVYLAEDSRLRRQIALKVPHFSETEDPRVIQRFYREARLAAQLTHPNLCPVFDVDCVDGVHFITMAYIEGTPLSHYIGADRPWPQARAVALICHLANVLQLLHQNGIVHRDLKPGNVMIRPDGTPVLMDFGLARAFDSASQNMTGSGKIIGTPAYMAPEQVAGDDRRIGPHTDIYALGVILYQLLTGEMPLAAPTPLELFARILHTQPVPPGMVQPGIDPYIDDICMQALAKDPGRRPASMIVFARMLQGVHTQTSVLTAESTSTAPSPRTLSHFQPTSPSHRIPTLPADAYPERRSNVLRFVAAGIGGLVLLVGLLVAGSLYFGNPEPTSGQSEAAQLKIMPLEDITLAAGEQQSLLVRVERQNCPGEIKLFHEGSIDDLHVNLLSIAPDSSTGEIRLRATREARSGQHTLRLIALGPNTRAEGMLRIQLRTLPVAGIRLQPFRTISLTAGQTQDVTIAIERVGYTGEVRLLQEGNIDGVLLRLAAIPAGVNQITVPLSSRGDTPEGQHRLRIIALGTDSARAEEPLDIVIKAAVVRDPQNVTNSLAQKFVRIAAGKFTMGTPNTEGDRQEDEGPQHEVEITQPYYVGIYEVTQDEFDQIMGKNPSYFSAKGGGATVVEGLNTKRFPVENVSWDEAVEFCKKLSELPEEKKAGRSYRLPTEAEWEYACRAGAQSYQVFHFGDALSGNDANFNGSRPYGGANVGPNLQRTTTVGSYKPNAFGLYDMHGNVWEWCSDWYDEKYYANSLKFDPQGPTTSPENARCQRGCSWNEDGMYCRSGNRSRNDSSFRSDSLGFRIVCVLTK